MVKRRWQNAKATKAEVGLLGVAGHYQMGVEEEKGSEKGVPTRPKHPWEQHTDDLDANFRRNIIQYKIKECYSDVILGLVYSIYDSPKAHMLKAVLLLGGKGMVREWAYKEVKGHCGHAHEGDIDALVSLKEKENLFLISKLLAMPSYF